MKRDIICVMVVLMTFVASADVMRAPRLRDVRLQGRPAVKMNAFFRERMLSSHAQHEIFGEARSAFRDRDDDEKLVRGKRIGGLWRGEFWGKLMLGTARVADYLQDESLLRFVKDECHRMMELQDDDGYLGSYGNKENVAIADLDKPAMREAYGWNTVWNIWNRKYCIWAMLVAYQVTGDTTILKSVVSQADQMIDMMHRLGIPLFRTGQPEKVGLPSMSILKPMLLLHQVTGNRKYLDFADEMILDWDRDDGDCPNLIRNANRPDALHKWYPNPQAWGKCYEMMSCLNGLLEHYRVTGDVRSLKTVKSIRENLAKSELNALGSVGYVDQFYGAANQPNSCSEVCDVIHWIRLNLDLFMITGEDRYLDAMEMAYFNAFLAGVFRDGTWGAFAVRDAVRHEHDRQCGYAYNHCCVNNMPRTFMDMAESTVTVDTDGVYHVNFYQDAKVVLDGVAFDISGNYPVDNVVTVKVSRPVKLRFRKPGWCNRLMESTVSSGVYRLSFDMSPRLVHRKLPPIPDNRKGWHFARYCCGCKYNNDPLSTRFRSDFAATLMRGPLLLAKSTRVGAGLGELLDARTLNGKDCSVIMSPTDSQETWGAWDVRFVDNSDGRELLHTRACDYQSAGDDPYGQGAFRFSVWF